jgi:hypothetical protein
MGEPTRSLVKGHRTRPRVLVPTVYRLHATVSEADAGDVRPAVTVTWRAEGPLMPIRSPSAS